jgi:citrate/tricarballylate utilization protein
VTVVENLVAAAATDAERLTAEGARIMQICNACRYCEGYCAVFPAMEKRLEFDAASLAYLSNLCHQCGACFYACQYAPPHEFAVNVPKVFTQLRLQSFEDYAWPRPFATAFRRNGVATAWALAGGLALFFMLAIALSGPGALWSRPAGSFYAVFPHNLLVGVFGVAFVFAILAIAIGAQRFRRAIGGGDSAKALGPALRLDNLGGGGEGCYVRAGFDHGPDRARRHFHHAVFYGFWLCFASTALATIYHYALKSPAPYPLTHPVVLLGTFGGIGMVIGCVGLMALKGAHDPVVLDVGSRPMNVAFTHQLVLTALTGLALPAFRETAAMPSLLAVHLGVVLALFLTMPYGKFVHGVYRWIALSRQARDAGGN